MPALIAVVAAAAAVSAASATGVLATVIFGVTFFAVSTGLQLLGLGVSDPSTDSFVQRAQGRTQMVRQAITPMRKLYGEVRVSGPVVFIESADGGGTVPNELLYFAVALAGHQCESIADVKFFDTPVANYGSKAQVSTHLGTDTQAASALLLESPSWTAAHRLRSIAYLAGKLTFDPDFFPSGIPNATALARGENRVLDPRDAGRRWTQNPALICADYLLDAEFGFGAADTEIDWASVVAAANICDEIVANPQGGTHKRYTFNGTYDADQPRKAMLQQITDAMAGNAVFVGGKWFIYAGAWQTPTLELTESDLRGAPSVRPLVPRNLIANSIRGTFYQRDSEEFTDFPAVSNAAYIAADNGEAIWADVQFPNTDNPGEAQRLAKIKLERLRREYAVTFPCKWSGFRLAGHSTMMLTLPNWGFQQRTFRVVDYKRAADGTGIDLELQEEDATVYAWGASDGSALTPPPPPQLPPATMDPPTALQITKRVITLADGATQSQLELSWTAPTTPFLDRYDVQYRVTGEPNWISTPPVPRDQTSWQIDGLAMDAAYDFRIRAVSASGIRSAWASTNETAQGDTDAPAAPTTLSVIGGFRQLAVRWRNPVDQDFSHTKVFVRQNTTPPTDTDLVGSKGGGRGDLDEIVIGQLDNSTTYYVWVAAVDRSGNQSALVGPQSASTQRILEDDIQDGIITTAKFAQGIEPVGIVDALPNPVGYTGPAVVLLTTDQKVYRYDPAGPQWTRAVDGADIIANTITAGQIAAGAIGTTELAADAVSADKLAADSVIAGKIAAGAVETASMNVGTINFDRLSPASVDIITDMIRANAVTTLGSQIAGALTINQGSWTTIASVALTTIGKPVKIDFTALMAASGGTGCSFRILRNGAELWASRNVGEAIRNFMYLDSPAAAAYTYAIQAIPFAAASQTAFQNRFLVISEIKR